mmetsp:Transcript_1217/g.2247  ORF Transcript_1217/g.2247 Transcript_1217/m.2247 type:complete len:278 (-) Transcript_1217:15-848(-)
MDQQAIQSLLIITLFCTSYVGILYIPYNRQYPRDSVLGIQRRSMSTIFVSILCFLFTFIFLSNFSAPFQSLFQPTDLTSILTSTLSSICLIISVYLPILIHHLHNTLQDSSYIFTYIFDQKGWFALRNYFIAPITEEIVFRKCSIDILSVTTSFNTAHTVILPALLFSFAHFHHVFRFLKSDQQTTLQNALLVSIFQMSYTLLFGIFSGWLYIKTHSILGSMISHILCNILGVPDYFSVLKSHSYSVYQKVGYMCATFAIAPLLFSSNFIFNHKIFT